LQIEEDEEREQQIHVEEEVREGSRQDIAITKNENIEVIELEIQVREVDKDKEEKGTAKEYTLQYNDT